MSDHNNDQNMAVMAKRIWGVVRVMYYMLRKGVSSKRKLLLDLNMFMKRRKLAGKAAIATLLSLSASGAASFRRTNTTATNSSGDYEFSCTNTPARPYNNNNNKYEDEYDEAVVRAAMEMLGSPAITAAAFGRSPAVVRQLRVTDSPFPLRDVVDSRPVDEAAEAFIKRFYKDLNRQSIAE